MNDLNSIIQRLKRGRSFIKCFVFAVERLIVYRLLIKLRRKLDCLTLLSFAKPLIPAEGTAGTGSPSKQDKSKEIEKIRFPENIAK